VMLETAVSGYPFAFFLLLLAAISLVSSWLANLIVSGERRRYATLKMAAAGCFTIIGTIIGSRFFLAEKRTKFVLVHSLAFVATTLVLLYLISAMFS
jgi:hypothetical protein